MLTWLNTKYMKSLRAMSTKKRGKEASGSRKQSKKKSEALIDLNADSDDDDGDGNMTFMEREKEQLEKLKNARSGCFKCGSEKVCLIAKNSAHVQLTLNQQRAWANALVSLIIHLRLQRCTHRLILHKAMGSQNVTLTTPPKGRLFEEFFTSIGSNVVSGSVPETPLRIPNPFAAAMSPAYPFMPMGYHQPWMPTPPPQPHFSSHYSHIPGPSYYPQLEPRPTSRYRKDNMPSSDPPDEDLHKPCYPDITDFITKLDEKHSKRNLVRHINDFELKDFYTIDEVAKLPNDSLCTQFGFTIGNAQFFLGEVQKEVKRIDRKSRSRNY
jgi:hypothetical protein